MIINVQPSDWRAMVINSLPQPPFPASKQSSFLVPTQPSVITNYNSNCV